MKCWATLAASCAFLIVAPVANAASKDNPAFNSNNKAWLVKYGTLNDARNKMGDCAVQLHLTDGGTWYDRGKNQWKISGTFYRYDNASSTTGKYTRRSVAQAGKIVVSGWVSFVPKNSKTRRPIRFELSGAIPGTTNTLDIRGFVHTGKKKKVTTDDLLTIRYSIKTGAANGGGTNKNTNLQPQPTPARSTVNSKVPCKQCSEEEQMPAFIDGQALLPVAFFQPPPDPPCPCEEEPDTDVLTEEPYDPTTEDPDYDPEV